MFSRLFHYIKGPSPLHPSVVANRLSPLTFRQFEPRDLDRCLELYALNEPDRFPEGVAKRYEEALTGGHSYFLVAEANGQIIASGGLSYSIRKDIAVLCFGLVHPAYQGKGIGTSLLLARLALLKPKLPAYHVFIFAVERSFGFYRRFGFQDFQAWKDPHGKAHPSGHLLVTDWDIGRIRVLLKKNKITVPEDEDKIPFRAKDEM